MKKTEEFSFKDLTFKEQKKLLLKEIHEAMKEIEPGMSFSHFLCYIYDNKVAEAVLSELGQKLGQRGRYFSIKPPISIAWIEFERTSLGIVS